MLVCMNVRVMNVCVDEHVLVTANASDSHHFSMVSLTARLVCVLVSTCV